MPGQQDLLEMIASGVALPAVLEALTRFIEARSNGLLCSILLLDDDGLHLRHGAAPSLPESYNRAIDGVAIGPGAGSCGTAAYRSEAVIVSDIERDLLWERYREPALALGLRACWSTPIISTQGRVLGTFAMYYHDVRAPSREEFLLIGIATHLARIAIERKQAEDDRAALIREQAARAEAEEATRRFAFLAQANKLLASSLDYETTLTHVARLAVDHLADCCAIHLWEPDGSISRLALEHRPSRSEEADPVLEQLDPSNPTLRSTLRVLQTGRSELISAPPFGSDASSELPTQEREQCSSIAVPLLARGQVIGSITLLSSTPGRRYDVTDLQLAEELAACAALAIDNVRLHRERLTVAAEHEAILAHMADAVIQADPAGRIVYVNPAARDLLGIDRAVSERAALDSVTQILQPLTPGGEPVPREEIALERALRGEVVLNLERPVRRVDGRTIVTETSAAPVVTADGRHLGAVAVFRDVTAQRESERQKDEFLSAATHDLRTPLTIIKGQAQFLHMQVERLGAPGTAPLLERLHKIDVTATQMAHLVDTLLDVSRLQTGQPLELRLTRVDLIDLARRVIAEIPFSARRHHLVITTDLRELYGLYDVDRIERVISNLASNAVKYSPDGGEIEIAIRREDLPDGSWSVLQVSDQGMGIPSDDIPRVFERFYRGHNVSGKIPGTGIGLTGVKQIVEHHGGSVSVQSEAGKGTIFTIRLPLRPSGDEA